MAMVIGLILWGSLFFINAAIWEPGSWLAAGPSGFSGSHKTPDSQQDLGLGMGDWWGWGAAWTGCSEDFQET